MHIVETHVVLKLFSAFNPWSLLFEDKTLKRRTWASNICKNPSNTFNNQKPKLHTRWDRKCKKIIKNKKHAHPIGASLLFDSLAMGFADAFVFLLGLCGFLPFGSKDAKTIQKSKKTAHLYPPPLQASSTPLYRYLFWDVLVAHL